MYLFVSSVYTSAAKSNRSCARTVLEAPAASSRPNWACMRQQTVLVGPNIETPSHARVEDLAPSFDLVDMEGDERRIRHAAYARLASRIVLFVFPPPPSSLASFVCTMPSQGNTEDNDVPKYKEPGDLFWDTYLKAAKHEDEARPKNWEGSTTGILTFVRTARLHLTTEY